MVNREYKGEAFFLDEKNQAHIQYYSLNKIRIKVIINKPGTLVVNQNYHKSWRTNIGKLSDHNGLLAVIFDEPEDCIVQLTYVPQEFYRGLTVSIVSLLLAYYFLIYKKSRINAAPARK